MPGYQATFIGWRFTVRSSPFSFRSQLRWIVTRSLRPGRGSAAASPPLLPIPPAKGGAMHRWKLLLPIGAKLRLSPRSRVTHRAKLASSKALLVVSRRAPGSRDPRPTVDNRHRHSARTAQAQLPSNWMVAGSLLRHRRGSRHRRSDFAEAGRRSFSEPAWRRKPRICARESSSRTIYCYIDLESNNRSSKKRSIPRELAIESRVKEIEAFGHSFLACETLTLDNNCCLLKDASLRAAKRWKQYSLG
jgi:hypothetical protein